MHLVDWHPVSPATSGEVAVLEFTGERYVPSQKGEIRHEHLHRYAMALELAAGLDVLDVACGEGYGSSLLASRAKSVIGVDVDRGTIEHARRTYAAASGLSFVEASATELPLPDDSVDFVVSFETIEHLADQVGMLREIRRVLRPGGTVLISSPNREIYSNDRDYANEHHVRELDFEEFDALLAEFFESREYFAQRFVITSTIVPTGDATSKSQSWISSGPTVREGLPPPTRVMYHLAHCGDAGAKQLKTGSFFYDIDQDLYVEQLSTLKWASGVDREYLSLQQHTLELDRKLLGKTAEADLLREELNAKFPLRSLLQRWVKRAFRLDRQA